MPDTSHIAARFTKDEQLEDFWQQVLMLLLMAEDVAADGAVLTVSRPSWIGPGADPIENLRVGVIRKIDAILANAVVK